MKLKASQVEDALSLWEDALRLNPSDKLTHFWMGRALLPLDREKALSHLKAAQSSWYFINLAKLHTKDRGEVEDWVKLAVSICDEDSVGLYLEAADLLLNEDPGYAISLIEESKELEGGYRHTSYLMLGVAFYHLGDWDAAISALQSGLQRYPDDPGLHYRLGLTLWEKSGKHSVVGEAVEHFEKALQLYPRWLDKLPLSALGDMYYYSGNYARAVYWYEQLVEVASGSPAFYVDLAKAYKRSGDLMKAEKTLRQAIEQWPNRERFRFIIADIYLSLGAKDEACREFKEGLNRIKDLDSYRYSSEVNTSLVELCRP
jgi:tetratricopeptide (TPR) repeat protein